MPFEQYSQYIDDFKDTFDSNVNEAKAKVKSFLDGPKKFSAGPSLLRYPSELGSSDYEDMPFMLFMVKKMEYNARSAERYKTAKNPNNPFGQPTRIPLPPVLSPRDITSKAEDYICLYMPNSISFSDTAKYEIQSASGLLSTLLGGGDLGMGDLKVALQKTAKDVLKQLGGGGVSKELFQGQDVQSPREFVTFQAPSLREFSFTYKFMPKSLKESENVEKIIKTFRYAMYPLASPSGYKYTIPNSFSISFNNVNGMNKLPEVVLTSCQVNYNPTNPTYLSNGQPNSNRPSEIDMTLSFQEVEAIDKNLVDLGY